MGRRRQRAEGSAHRPCGPGIPQRSGRGCAPRARCRSRSTGRRRSAGSREAEDVKIGITLPTFEQTSEAALATALAADHAGIDGIFAFDHLWPIGQKSRPALSMYPVLGAVAAVTSRIRIGSLVARIGLLPDR